MCAWEVLAWRSKIQWRGQAGGRSRVATVRTTSTWPPRRRVPQSPPGLPGANGAEANRVRRGTRLPRPSVTGVKVGSESASLPRRTAGCCPKPWNRVRKPYAAVPSTSHYVAAHDCHIAGYPSGDPKSTAETTMPWLPSDRKQQVCDRLDEEDATMAHLVRCVGDGPHSTPQTRLDHRGS